MAWISVLPLTLINMLLIAYGEYNLYRFKLLQHWFTNIQYKALNIFQNYWKSQVYLPNFFLMKKKFTEAITDSYSSQFPISNDMKTFATQSGVGLLWPTVHRAVCLLWGPLWRMLQSTLSATHPFLPITNHVPRHTPVSVANVLKQVLAWDETILLAICSSLAWSLPSRSACLCLPALE